MRYTRGDVDMTQARNALITGSTSGIGLALADYFASKGMDIYLNGLGDRAEIDKMVADMAQKYSVKVYYSDADMTDPAAIEAMMAEAEKTFGGLDVLVNNAGIQHVSPVQDFPTNMWDKIIAINLTSAFHTIKAAVPGMKERGFGRIINIASAHALIASPFKSAYVAAKHGIAGLTKTVALELAQDGITANAICPGYVKTPLVEAQIPDTAKARGMTEEEVINKVILAAQPTKKFVGPQELAALAYFMTSTEAASMTGAIVSMDGGWSAQ